MIKQFGNYFVFISSVTGQPIPVKYINIIANQAKKLKLWYAVDYHKMYVKVRIFNNKKTTIAKIKKLLKS